VILVMRMLGEMAVANPSVGSFTDYNAQRDRAVRVSADGRGAAA
jgi:amino acid permease